MKEFNFEKELLGVQDELFRFAYKLTANREKAEDLLQDTLLKAMLHKESYNKNTNFKGWLFIIMRNTFINGYRAEVGHTRLLNAGLRGRVWLILRSCILFADHGRVPYRGGGQEL